MRSSLVKIGWSMYWLNHAIENRWTSSIGPCSGQNLGCMCSFIVDTRCKVSIDRISLGLAAKKVLFSYITSVFKPWVIQCSSYQVSFLQYTISWYNTCSNSESRSSKITPKTWLGFLFHGLATSPQSSYKQAMYIYNVPCTHVQCEIVYLFLGEFAFW